MANITNSITVRATAIQVACYHITGLFQVLYTKI